MIGTGKPYLQEGQWLLNLNARVLTSDKHYNLDERQFSREVLRNNVVNRQRQYELGATYAFSERFNLSASLPYVSSSWAINTRPFTGASAAFPGPDVIDNRGSGIGDVSFTGRLWLGDTQKNLTENISVGLGVKLPTGDNDDTSPNPNFTGANRRNRFSDISVQPGDGGVGIIFDTVAFKKIGKTTYNFAASYLANPRDTNDTPSIITQLFDTPPTAAQAPFLLNSVPDTYFARLGFLHPIGKQGLLLSMAYRVEGSPRKDLFGENNGFRRNGYETFFEPGLVYSNGPHTFNFSVPIGHNRFRGLNSVVNPVTGVFDRGDATFPDYIVLAGYSYRFGGKNSKNDCAAPKASAPSTGDKTSGATCGAPPVRQTSRSTTRASQSVVAPVEGSRNSSAGQLPMPARWNNGL